MIMKVISQSPNVKAGTVVRRKTVIQRLGCPMDEREWAPSGSGNGRNTV